MFSNTFAGIAPTSVVVFIIAQSVGAGLALLAVRLLYPQITPADAAEVVVPHSDDDRRRGSAVAALQDGGTA
jgi:hypothetical protein